MKIDCYFNGRKLGAIGITYPIKKTLEIEQPIGIEEIRLMLYEEFEQISDLRISDDKGEVWT